MSYEIIQADLYNHKQDLLSIWQRNFPEVNDLPKRYSWLLKNPYGLPKCWLAQNSNTGEFVGCAFLIPRKMFFNGELVDVGIASDFAIDKEHRVLGPALQLQKAVIVEVKNGNYRLIYGFPNKLAEPIHLRSGYKILSSTQRMVKLFPAYFKITKHWKYIDVKVGILIEYILQIRSREKKYKKNRSIIIETPTFFDKRFDTLWDNVSQKIKIIGERTASYLNWRYIENPLGGYNIFTICDTETKDILGYIIYKFQKDIVHVFDILSKDKDDYLLSMFINFMRHKVIASISILTHQNHPILSKLANFRFFKRPEDLNIVAYIENNNTPVESIMEALYMMAGDSDVP